MKETFVTNMHKDVADYVRLAVSVWSTPIPRIMLVYVTSRQPFPTITPLSTETLIAESQDLRQFQRQNLHGLGLA